MSIARSAGDGHLTWQRLSGQDVSAVSCATDHHRDILTSTDPAHRHPTWRLTRVDNYPLTSITCRARGVCLAVENHGRLVHDAVS